MKKFYVTTPIYYPNDKPHVGTAYTTTLADIFARFFKLYGYETYFLTGTDEHGKKLELEARKKGVSPKEFVDAMVLHFKYPWKKLKINYDRFIRTTDKDHEEVVKEILMKVYEKGEIYKGKYEGWYCVRCERYFSEDDLIKEGDRFLCPIHKREVTWLSIDAYFFKLSKYKDKILELLQNEEFLPYHREEMINRVKKGLKDLCISRPKKQLSWGIELPFDKEHVAYVWFDALLNYVSGVGYKNDKEKFSKFWPPDLQLIGKDIVWFHSVIWPAMLMAANLPLPKTILAHGFLTVEGEKISKSLGNVYYPEEIVERYGVDALRYYYVREISLGSDGDFSVKKLIERYNNELAKDYGNLVNRVIKLSLRFGRVEKEIDEEVKNYFDGLIDQVYSLLRKYKINEVVNKIVEAVHYLNSYINSKEPWKNKENKIYYSMLEGLRIINLLFSPILVEGSEKVKEGLNCKESKLKFGEVNKYEVKEIPIIYNKIEEFVKKRKEREKANFDDFKKIKIKVGKVIEVKRINEKLLHLKVSFGKEIKNCVAGIGKFYNEKELLNRKFVFVTNLIPKKICNVESEVMILAASDDKVSLITVDKDIEEGSIVT